MGDVTWQIYVPMANSFYNLAKLEGNTEDR